MLAKRDPDKIALADWHADRRREHHGEDEHDDRDFSIERVVFRQLAAHFFSAGPQPEEVLQRIFAATADRRPDLLRGFSPREIKLSREESANGRKWRWSMLFPNEENMRARYREIIGTLRAAHAANRRREVVRVTLTDALTINGAEPVEASETLSRVLERIFSAGNDPRAVVQHAYALLGFLFRNVQLNMSFEALGALFAEERATQSWRSNKLVSDFLRKAGCRGCKAGWAKPASAVEKFREAARGNQCRRKRRRRTRKQSINQSTN